MLNITPIPAFKDNYIWMLSDESNHTWVVDPGEAAPVINILKKTKLALSAILITHHHADHSGGIADLIDFAGQIPVYGSNKSPLKLISHHLNDNDIIRFNKEELRVMEIPGHTLDHIAFVGNNFIFCGDTLFSAGCGRIFEGTALQMNESLQKIARLNPKMKIYCGHEYTRSNLLFAQHIEPDNLFIRSRINEVNQIVSQDGCTLPTLLEVELRTNPFLRCTQTSVIHTVEQHCKTKLSNPVDVFYQLREWKNHFKT